MTKRSRRNKSEKKKERDALRKEKKQLKKLEKLGKMEKKMLVAVYGSLKKGLHNHRCLDGATYIGNFVSTPIYNLYDLGSYPGLKKNGNSAVHMEIYEIDETLLHKLDQLEGYTGIHAGNSNLYNREEIETPFGKAYIYFYNYMTDDNKKVNQIDWKDYYDSKHIRNLVN